MPENRPVKRIGFIGLGDMGLPMAQNLIKAGFEVCGFDLRTERLDLLKKQGGLSANSISELGKLSDVVFVMVMTGKQVSKIILGDNGLLKFSDDDISAVSFSELSIGYSILMQIFKPTSLNLKCNY